MIDRELEVATGQHLDEIGLSHDLDRLLGEPDDVFRSRIRSISNPNSIIPGRPFLNPVVILKLAPGQLGRWFPLTRIFLHICGWIAGIKVTEK